MQVQVRAMSYMTGCRWCTAAGCKVGCRLPGFEAVLPRGRLQSLQGCRLSCTREVGGPGGFANIAVRHQHIIQDTGVDLVGPDPEARCSKRSWEMCRENRKL